MTEILFPVKVVACRGAEDADQLLQKRPCAGQLRKFRKVERL